MSIREPSHLRQTVTSLVGLPARTERLFKFLEGVSLDENCRVQISENMATNLRS